MNTIIRLTLAVMVTAILLSFTYAQSTDSKPYKCMVQMSNYSGEGAYIAISVVDAKNQYIKTLKVFGDDDEWFPELKNWWKSNKSNKKLTAVDAISGETLVGGERQIFALNIPDAYINKGYALRFESAVEDNSYKATDVVIPLNTSTIKNKVDGNGYIRYVRLIPAK
ncbi:DUF2271 domain-containing protein [Flavobacteriaceae bacterium Ap0902]|nr:DUF2271 domain-containing protein [Flavobacteriaceae bacterium Ap0902]